MPVLARIRSLGARALCACALAAMPGIAAAAPPALDFVQGPGAAATVRLNVYVDQRRNRAELKRITEDGSYPGYAYGQAPAGDRVRIGLDAPALMRLWKGGATITPASGELLESADQFLPVLLIVDVTNDGVQPAQVSGSYLEVAASQSDLQPLILMGNLGVSCTMSRTPNFLLTNVGWGRAENASLLFAFGRDRPTTQAFQLALGPLGSVDASVAQAVGQLGPRLDGLRRRAPTCPSTQQLPQCLARLERDGALGGFAGIARVHEGGEVVTHLSGMLAYTWHDANGAAVAARSPVETDVTLFFIEAGAPECGAGAPGEGGFRPVKLALDRSNYTLPLPYRGRLGPRENRRLELALVADRASRHLLRVVVELSDGRRIASTPMEIGYFTPRIPQGEPRPVR